MQQIRQHIQLTESAASQHQHQEQASQQSEHQAAEMFSGSFSYVSI